MTLHFTIEPFQKAATDVWPMVEAAGEEVGFKSMGFQFQPNWEMFIALDEIGALMTATARTEDNETVGWVVWTLAPGLFHVGMSAAQADTIFFRKEYRNPWDVLRFLQFCEEALIRRGCNMLIINSWAKDSGGDRKDLAPLMRRSGYKLQKLGYWKNIQGE